MMSSPGRRGTTRPDLVFDLGMNQGEDTEFYLSKGFHVVAVEANPAMVAAALPRLAPHAGRYVIEAVGLAEQPGTLPFYANLDNDHWSSFDRAYGTRQGTRFEVIEVPCVTLADLIARHGVPRYMKIDIEGADRTVLRQLAELGVRPDFLSIEEYGVPAFADLEACGYTRFNIVPQNDKSWQVPPKPPREGRYVARSFTGKDSGLFGRELPGPWMGLPVARGVFERFVRRADHRPVGPPGEWYDIHATTSEALALRAD
jgi:FkbM family methyltransferase